jgi:hypothetical protein
MTQDAKLCRGYDLQFAVGVIDTICLEFPIEYTWEARERALNLLLWGEIPILQLSSQITSPISYPSV